jgi:cytochrome P450
VFAGSVAPFAGVPGPQPSFPLGNVLDFIGPSAWDVVERYARAHGPLAVFWMLNTPTVIPVDPVLVDEVLTTRKLEFYKAEPFKAQLPLLSAQHPFLANFPEWPEVARRSPMGMPSFQTWLSENVPIAAERAAATLDELVAKHDDTNLEAADLIRRVVFRMMCRMIIGLDISWDDYAYLATLGDIGAKRMFTVLPISKTPTSSKFKRSFEGWRSLHMAEVRRARSEPLDGRVDMLAYAVRDESELDDFGLAAEMASRYFGGMYSSSVGAVNTLYCLTQRPDVLAPLRAEVRALFSDGPAYGREQLEACELLDSVVRESLRLYSPIPVFLRRSDPKRTVELGPAKLPPDTLVMLRPWAGQRHPDHWAVSITWHPER